MSSIASSYVTGGMSRAGGGGAAPTPSYAPGTLAKAATIPLVGNLFGGGKRRFAGGGPWGRYIGRRVLTGERGVELAVAKDGTVQPLGAAGPQVVVPQRPATVIPNEALARLQVPLPRPQSAVPVPAPTAAKIAPDDAPAPQIQVPAPTKRAAVQLDAATDQAAPLVDPQVAAGSAQPDANVPHMGRGRAFLLAALSALGPAAANAQAAANARGDGVRGSDVASALVAGGAAGAAGALAPRAVAYALQRQQKARVEADRARQQQFDLGQAKIDETRAQAQQRAAQPLIEQAKLKYGYDRLDAAALRAERQAVASVFNRLEVFDPEAPENADTVARMHALGLPVVAKARGQQLKFVQDQQTGALSVVAGDRTTGQASAAPVLNVPRPSPRATQPPVAPEVVTPDTPSAPALIVPQPTQFTTVSPGQIRTQEGAANRTVRQTEGAANRAARAAEGAANRAAARARHANGGGRGNPHETKLLDDFAREKQLGYSAPTNAERKKHMANAQGIGATLQANHGYEFGADERGNPYVKAPQTAPRAGAAAYTGQKFPRSRLSALRQHLGLSSDAEVEQFITERGGTVVNQ